MTDQSQTNDPINETLEKARESLLKGDELAKQSQPLEATVAYDKSIELIEGIGQQLPPQGVYLLAGAYLNKGNIFASRNNEESSAAAVTAYERAIQCYSQIESDGNDRFYQEFAALWSNLSQVKLRNQKRESIVQATQCLENAIKLYDKVPWKENDDYRRQLIGLWLNLGNAYHLVPETPYRRASVDAYDTGIELTQTLSLEEKNSGSVVATLWLNRGNTFRSVGEPESLDQAIDSYDEAIRIFRNLDVSEDKQIGITFGAALAYKALVITGDPRYGERLAESDAAAQEALGLVKELEEKHVVAGEVGLLSRQALCQASCHRITGKADVYQDPDYEKATDLIDEALDLVCHFEKLGVPRFRGSARQLFGVGTQLYSSQQPHFLAEFVLENLDPEREKGSLAADAKAIQIGINALNTALAMLKERRDKIPIQEQASADGLEASLQEGLQVLEKRFAKKEEEGAES